MQHVFVDWIQPRSRKNFFSIKDYWRNLNTVCELDNNALVMTIS